MHKKSSMARGSIMPGEATHAYGEQHDRGEQHAQGEQHARGSSMRMVSSITGLCITYLNEIEGNFVSLILKNNSTYSPGKKSVTLLGGHQRFSV